MTMMSEQQSARNFLAESDGDLGLAIYKLRTRIEVLEAKLSALVAEFDQQKADAIKAKKR